MSKYKLAAYLERQKIEFIISSDRLDDLFYLKEKLQLYELMSPDWSVLIITTCKTPIYASDDIIIANANYLSAPQSIPIIIPKDDFFKILETASFIYKKRK